MEIKELIKKIKDSDNMSGVMRIINNNKFLIDNIIDMTNHLDKETNIYERLYNIKNDLYQHIICPICNNNNLEWDNKYKRYKKWCSNKECKNKYIIQNKDIDSEMLRRIKISNTHKNKTKEEKDIILKKIKETNLHRYGKDSYAKTDEFKNYMLDNYGYISPFEKIDIRNKSKKTLLKKYGVDHNFKIKDVREKREKTFIDKYGVNIPTKNEQIKQKTKETNNIKYGGNSPMNNKHIHNKSKKTLIENYNVDYPLKSNKIMKKMTDTMESKYGVKYWIQDIDNFNNLQKRFSYKKYKLENGDEINLQGYEDYVFFEKLLIKYDINDICISNNDIYKKTGKLYYEFNNKEHKYYPDFYIISENKIIEVKSDYTYNINIEKNEEKKKMCINKGFDFEFFIVDKKTYNEWKKNKKQL